MATRVVNFKTYDGLKLEGTLYPAGEKRPCIIMTTGFGGLRQSTLPDFAVRFQAAGFTVLTYDNRCWGGSEGLPRNEVDPVLQGRDYLDAFAFAITLPEADPEKIVYWGSSMSGGTAAYASVLNKKIAATILQVPFMSGEWAAQTASPPSSMLVMERANAIATGTPATIPTLPGSPEEVLNGTSKAALNQPEVLVFMSEIAQRGWQWGKEVTVQSLSNLALFEPLALIHRISPTPLLMVVATNDTTTVTHVQLEAFNRAREPKKLQLMTGEDHFSVYFGEAFEKNVKAQIAFLNETLGL